MKNMIQHHDAEVMLFTGAGRKKGAPARLQLRGRERGRHRQMLQNLMQPAYAYRNIAEAALVALPVQAEMARCGRQKVHEKVVVLNTARAGGFYKRDRLTEVAMDEQIAERDNILG